MADVIRTLTIRSKTEGVTQTVGDMDKLAASTDKVVKASVEQERTTLSVEKAYNRLQRQLDDAFRAQEQLARVQKTLQQAQAQGLVTQQRSSELMQAAVRHYNTAGGSLEKLGNSSKLSRFELINLSRQIQDVGVSLQAGQGAFTVFIQQGSQIFDVVQSSGMGLAGFGKALLGLVTPVRAVVVGATALAAAGVLVFNSWLGVEKQFLNLSERIDTPIGKLRDLQAAAQVRGLDVGEFVSGMEKFGEQVSLAQRGLGDLAQLFRSNGREVGNVEQSLKTVADLIANASTGQEKYAIAAAAGIPPTAEWIRLLGQGGAALQSSIDGMSKIGKAADQELILKARAFDEAWSEAWKNFTTNAQSAVLTAASFLGGLIDKASQFLTDQQLRFRTASELGKQALGAGIGTQLSPEGAAKFYDTIKGAEKGLAQEIDNRKTRTLEALKADEQRLALDKQRIQLLGDLATPQQKAAIADREINLAREKGVQISEKEQAAIVKNIELDLKHGAKLKELKTDYRDIERAVSSFADTFINSMLEGATATQALGHSLEGLGSQLIRLGTQDFAKQISGSISGIFSQLGSFAGPIGSILTGAGVSLIGKLFGGGDDGKERAEAQKRAAEAERQRQEREKMIADAQIRAADYSLRAALAMEKSDFIVRIKQFDAASQKAFDEESKRAGDLAIWQLVAARAAERTKLIADTIEEATDTLAGNELSSVQQRLKDIAEASKTLTLALTELGNAVDVSAAEQTIKAIVALADSALTIEQPLSDVQQRMRDLTTNAADLTQALIDAGLSAEEAADIINRKLNTSIDQLRTSFLDDLGRQLKELSGGAWINQADDLAQKVQQMRSDAAALGIETGMILDFYTLSAQKIVDENKLTGDSFLRLQAHLGLANTSLHEFNDVIEETAEVVKRSADEIANAVQSNEDRLFRAQRRSDSLDDQLARFDLSARREVEAEMKAGGEARASLERALQQERNNIIADFNAKQLQEQLEAQKKAADEAERARQKQLEAERQAAEERARILEEAQRFLEGALRNISEFITHFLAGAQSYLSPFQRLQQARASFAQQFSQAVGGNRDALSGITQNAQDVIEATRAYYGSAAAGQSIIADLISQLQGLPNQVSAEEFIVDGLTDPIEAVETSVLSQTQILQAQMSALQTAINSGSASAIASALLPMFSSLDTNLDDLLDFNEFQTGLAGMASNSALREMFTRLDTDNSGSISRLELINQAAQGISSDTDQLNPIQQNTDETASNTLQALNNLTAAVSNLSQILTQSSATNQGINISNQQLQTANASLATQTNTMIGVAQSTALLTNLNTNIASLLGIANISNNHLASISGFTGAISSWAAGSNHAMGGRITGGIPGKDSVHGMLTPGEFVVRAPVAQQSPWLDDFNRTGIMPNAANDNGGVIAAIHNLERTLLRGVSALIETQLQAAGIISRPIQEANKITRTRRGEKKKVA